MAARDDCARQILDGNAARFKHKTSDDLSGRFESQVIRSRGMVGLLEWKCSWIVGQKNLL
jgi:hypothetical protein